MLKYILGFFKNCFNKGVSSIALIDYKSHVSNRAKINHSVKIYQSNVDKYSYVGSKSELICVDIGKYCSIAHRCSLGLAGHSMDFISTSPIFTSKKNGTGYSWTNNNFFEESKRVLIGNDVWIGIEVIIMGGVEIGDGVVIGAGSIVTKNIPPYAIAVGVPAKVIKYRFEKDIIQKLLKIQWWNFPEDKLRKNVQIFQKNELSLVDLNVFE